MSGPSKQELTVSDLSKRQVGKAVFERTSTHPLTLYSTALGLGGLVGFVLIKSPLMIVVGGTLLGVGVSSFIVNHFFRYDEFATRYLESVHHGLREQRLKKREAIGERLKKLGNLQGHRQMEKLREKFENLVAILDQKLEKTEMTYGRYLGIAEQVYLGALDNLQHAATSLESVRTIDRAYIVKQLKGLDENGIENPEQDYENLRARLKLLEEVNQRVERLLQENEAAMTQLDLTAIKLAQVETRGGEAAVPMEAAMDELSHLAKTANLYEKV